MHHLSVEGHGNGLDGHRVLKLGVKKKVGIRTTADKSPTIFFGFRATGKCIICPWRYEAIHSMFIG